MTDCDWTNPHGGRQWRRLDDGRIEVEDAGVPRTNGPPRSMELFWEDFGEQVESARADLEAHFDFPEHLAAYVGAMAAAEASRRPHSLHMDPESVREEPGFESDEQTPQRVSAGLLQTLLSTAHQMQDTYGLWSPEATREDLFEPGKSILAGLAYMGHQAGEHHWDPVLVCAAYNAGGVYESENAFRLRVYGVSRIWRYVRYFNDFLAADPICLTEGGGA